MIRQRDYPARHRRWGSFIDVTDINVGYRTTIHNPTLWYKDHGKDTMFDSDINAAPEIIVRELRDLAMNHPETELQGLTTSGRPIRLRFLGQPTVEASRSPIEELISKARQHMGLADNTAPRIVIKFIVGQLNNSAPNYECTICHWKNKGQLRQISGLRLVRQPSGLQPSVARLAPGFAMV